MTKSIDAIVILGKGSQADGLPPPLVQHEIDYAVTLCKQQPIQAIIFTGAHWGLAVKRHDLTEARSMLHYASKLAPSAVQLIVEEDAQDTIGNAVYTQRLIAAQPWRSLLVISTVDHINRAQFIFERIFRDPYQLYYHGHQHRFTARQYRQIRRYEWLALCYARWFFYRLRWRHLQPSALTLSRYHFFYHGGLRQRLARRIVQRPAHR